MGSGLNWDWLKLYSVSLAAPLSFSTLAPISTSTNVKWLVAGCDYGTNPLANSLICTCIALIFFHIHLHGYSDIVSINMLPTVKIISSLPRKPCVPQSQNPHRESLSI